MKWIPVFKEGIPSKGVGRTNYRTLSVGNLYDWVDQIEYNRVLDEGGDIETIQIDLGEDVLPEQTKKDKKSKESTSREKEPLESSDNKRIRLGGPPSLPNQWRNKEPSKLVMSFTAPAVEDGQAMVFLQSTSQLPAFGRYSISPRRFKRTIDGLIALSLPASLSTLLAMLMSKGTLASSP